MLPADEYDVVCTFVSMVDRPFVAIVMWVSLITQACGLAVLR